MNATTATFLSWQLGTATRVSISSEAKHQTGRDAELTVGLAVVALKDRGWGDAESHAWLQIDIERASKLHGELGCVRIHTEGLWTLPIEIAIKA